MQPKKHRLSAAFPDVLRRSINEMGVEIAAARRVRRISQEKLAQEMCVSRNVVTRIEKGDPNVSFGAYMMAAWVMGLEGNLTGIFAREKDRVFLEAATLSLPRRVRQRGDGTDNLSS